jgi:hypothetical protein
VYCPTKELRVLFADRLHDPYALRGLCRSPKHSMVKLEEWLEHDEANEVSRPRSSPFLLAVLEFAVGKRWWAR